MSASSVAYFEGDEVELQSPESGHRRLSIKVLNSTTGGFVCEVEARGDQTLHGFAANVNPLQASEREPVFVSNGKVLDHRVTLQDAGFQNGSSVECIWQRYTETLNKRTLESLRNDCVFEQNRKPFKHI